MSKKIFSEQTKSKLSELYKSGEDVIQKNACLDLFGVPVNFNTILDTLKDQPFLTTERKSAQLNLNDFDFKKLDATIANINGIEKSKETAVVDIVKVQNHPEIKFRHSEMINIGGTPKFASPRLSINLSGHKIDAHLGVRINTGLAIISKSVAVGKTIADGVIVDSPSRRQPEFIVVPLIVSKHKGMIPTIYARDPEDTGLLTINFTTTEPLDTSKPLQVVLNAYTVSRPLGSAIIRNAENNTGELFKSKDNRTGRWVKNPKIKFLSNSFDVSTGALLLNTFDNTKTPTVCYEKQKIQIDNTITLFTSRKREWFDPNLVTVAGIYNPSTKKHSESVIIKSNDIRHNTHGMVFIKNKITLFSVDAPFTNDCRILNGAFSNIQSYSEINRDVRKMQVALHNLSIGAEICKKAEFASIMELLRVFDYERSILLDDPRLQTKLQSSDEKLFNERPAELYCYSVCIYNTFKSLAYQCCPNLFTDEQRKILSLTCHKTDETTDAAAAAKKRSSDDGDVNPAKSMKLM